MSVAGMAVPLQQNIPRDRRHWRFTTARNRGRGHQRPDAPRVCKGKLRLAAECLQSKLIVVLPEAIYPTLFCPLLGAAVLKLPRQHPSWSRRFLRIRS